MVPLRSVPSQSIRSAMRSKPFTREISVVNIYHLNCARLHRYEQGLDEKHDGHVNKKDAGQPAVFPPLPQKECAVCV